MIKLEKANEYNCYRLICDECHRGMPTFRASNNWVIESLGEPFVYTGIICIIGHNKQADLRSFKINDEQLPFVEEALAEFNASLTKKKQETMEGYISIKKADLVEVIWGICLSDYRGDVWISIKPILKALGIEDYHPASLLDKMKKMGLIPDYHRNDSDD